MDKAAAAARKRIVVTRAPEQAGEFDQLARRAWAPKSCCLPMVAFAASGRLGLAGCGAGRLAEFDWVLFTSQNAVRFFAERQRELGKKTDWSRWQQPVCRRRRAGNRSKQPSAKAFTWIYAAQNSTGESLARELAATRSQSSPVASSQRPRGRPLAKCPAAGRCARHRRGCLPHRRAGKSGRRDSRAVAARRCGRDRVRQPLGVP